MVPVPTESDLGSDLVLDTARVEMLEDSPQVQRFTGRVKELELLTSSEDTAHMFVLQGVAGIGKSWLAAEACSRLRGTRNLFWHHIRPWDSRQSVLLHLGEFLAALGRPNLRAMVVRNRTDRAANVLIQDLPGTRSVLVFDDAHQASEEVRQVFRVLLDALVHTTDVRTVLLTRRHLPFYDRRDVTLSGIVHEVPLDGLEMTEVLAILSTDGRPWANLPVAGKSLRHPLLLELCRANRSLPSKARADVQRFLEETILGELTETERRMMGLASLYELPVPSNALFLRPRWDEDVLLALKSRELLRSVGEERYEIHDTIREFFWERLTARERRIFGAFAVRQLNRLAQDSWAAKRFGSCANYLSNAVRIADPAHGRATLEEALGDAFARTGDLLALSVAYRQALTDAASPATRRRLHRKLAMALAEHGELDAALAEVEAASAIRGTPDKTEQGWLDLIRARVANRRDRYWEAETHARNALSTFRRSRDSAAVARASLELAYALSVPGTTDERGNALADRYYQDALRLASSVDDPWFRVRIHMDLAARRGQVEGDEKAVMQHLAAVESIQGAAEDPFVRSEVLGFRTWVSLVLLADFVRAEAEALEAIRLAQILQDPVAVAEAKLTLVGAMRGQGRLEDATVLSEETGREMLRLGFNRDRCISVLLSAGEGYLIRADREGWTRLLDGLNDLGLMPLSRYPHGVVFEAFDRLIEGDFPSVKPRFDQALKGQRDSATTQGLYSPLMESGIELYYAVALAAMGMETEAAVQRDRAMNTFRTRNYQNRIALAPVRERELLNGIHRMLRA